MCIPLPYIFTPMCKFPLITCSTGGGGELGSYISYLCFCYIRYHLESYQGTCKATSRELVWCTRFIIVQICIPADTNIIGMQVHTKCFGAKMMATLQLASFSESNKQAFSPQCLLLAVLTTTASDKCWGKKAWVRGYGHVRN